MKKHLLKILFAAAILLITGGVVLLPHTTLAASGTSLIEGFAVSGVNGIIAWIANIILGFTAWFLTICGVFLSISMNITVHIKDIYTSVKSIETVWIVIRDLSSMFIIFSLLYCSIETVLGRTKSGLNELIGKIFMAGILINFSLFFVKIAIDASNLVSLQFYNAITPETSVNSTVEAAFSDGGLSNVFMQSLKIPTIYKNTGVLKSADVAVGISFAAIGGIIMMFTAACSFLAAAIAFTIRTAILIFIMALSPLFFAGMIFPAIRSKVSDKLMSALASQLIFMPTYLFLLYIALRFISDPSFSSIFNSNASSGTSAVLGAVSIGVILQYVIAIIFINAPLLMAIQLGGIGMKWAPTASSISKRFGGFAGRKTLGRASKALGEKFDNAAATGKVFGSTTLFNAGSSVLRATNISQGIRSGLAKGEESKYGGSSSIGSIKKGNKERTKEVAGIKRTNDRQELIDTIIENKGVGVTPTQMTEFGKAVGKMGKKDLEDTEYKTLADPNFITKISSKNFDALMEGDSLTAAQQDALKDIRKKAIQDDIAKLPASTVKDLVKNLSGKELSKLDEAILTDNKTVDALTISQLKDMEDLGRPIKQRIRNAVIRGGAASTHVAYAFMNNAQTSANWS